MLSLALQTLRARKSGGIGALAAVTLASLLITSCGILLESNLRAPIAIDRLAAAPVLVQAVPTLQANGEKGFVDVPLKERTRLPASLAAELEHVEGVADTVADRSFSVEVTNRHGRLLRASTADRRPGT